MDNCLSHHKTLTPRSTGDPWRSLIDSRRRPVAVDFRAGGRLVRPLKVIAAAGASHCEFSSPNSPLGPRTPAAKDLAGVLQNHPQLFHLAAADELKRLADDRDAARDRMVLGAGSPEACLHRYLSFGDISDSYEFR